VPYLVRDATGESVKTSVPSYIYTLQSPLPVARRLLPHGRSLDPQIFLKRQGEKSGRLYLLLALLAWTYRPTSTMVHVWFGWQNFSWNWLKILFWLNCCEIKTLFRLKKSRTNQIWGKPNRA